MHIPKPTEEYIERLLKECRDDHFPQTDPALSKVFKIFPKNNDFHEVLVKVVLLNKLYNAYIFDPYPVAKHITNLSIDTALSVGSTSIIGKIAKVRFSHRERYLYSFATKYCSWHFPEKFFMYDNFVDRVIWEYKRRFEFNNFFRYELKEYERYHEILLSFIDFFKLGNISKKKLDEFLWLEGLRISNKL